jgi:phosphate transport system protein
MPIQQMDALKERLAVYARFVEEMIVRSRTALVEQQPDILSGIIEEDEPRANRFEMDLEEECTSIIAQHQPMARDLRTLLMILRITNDLERIADHAVNIALSVRELLAGFPPPPADALPRMFEETIIMVDCAIRSFIGGDAALGQKVCETDTSVDTLATGILERVSASMSKSAASVSQSLAVLKIAGNLERIADLSTNIGEDVIYMTEGRVIKHHREEQQ